MEYKYMFPNREKVVAFSKREKSEDKIQTKVLSVPNGFILPCKNKDPLSGGVCNSEGKFLEESLYIGDWLKCGGEYYFKREEAMKNKINEKVLYLGFFVKHWGHFLVDCIGRMWILNNQKYKDYKIIFLSKNNAIIDGNFMEFLNLLGVSNERIKVVSKPCQFEEIIIPSLANSKNQYSEKYMSVFRKVVESANLSSIIVPSRIYLSRSKFKDAKKKEIGEKIIECAFKKNGFRIMYPEKMSLRKQIAIFQKAQEVVCVNGSIALNVVFANYKLKLVVINKTSLKHENFINAAHMVGIDPIYIDAYMEPIEGHPRYLGEGPFWLAFNINLKQYFNDNYLSYYIKKHLVCDYCMYYLMYFYSRSIALARSGFKKMIGSLHTNDLNKHELI